MTTPCTCCNRRPDEIPREQSASRVFGNDGCCHPCQAHKGYAQAADREHRLWWRAQLDQQQRVAEATRLDFEARIAALEAELEQEKLTRPERLVEKWINQSDVDAERAEAQRAFRSREMAFRQLSLVRLIHREGIDGRCRCGVLLAKCETFNLVDGYSALVIWERDQLRRHRNRLPHALPLDHPMLHDPKALARFLHGDDDFTEEGGVESAS